MTPAAPPVLSQLASNQWKVTGNWTVLEIGDLATSLKPPSTEVSQIILNGAALSSMDSAGALVLNRWLGANASKTSLIDWPEPMKALMAIVAEKPVDVAAPPTKTPLLEEIGVSTWLTIQECVAFLRFLGENSAAALNLLLHPHLIRWRTTLRNIQIDGFDALPIIGLTSFLLGIVVAFQGAGQLKNYGANIFVVDLVGYSMLREFAPLISAIIIAGRSGSAYAAQIGTMVVTEEVDALRTLAINPLELLVLPKVLALAIALPLLTVFADITGVFGGMVMAQSQLDIGFHEFIDRFGREMKGATLLLGIGKSFVFAIVISLIGCFQGFRAKGGADSVGRQTTRSVVQSIFLVIVADALFSIVFNLLDL